MIITEIDPKSLKFTLKQPHVGKLPTWMPSQIRLCEFYESRCWVVTAETSGQLVSFNLTKVGKRRKNIWEPYANWYLAYTVPAYRRQGYAKELGLFVRKRALEWGCRRIKSLAGSWAGAALHASMGDVFWGLTPNGEAVVDSPLDMTVDYPQDVLPGSVRNALKGSPEFELPAKSLETLKLALAGVPLCYDRVKGHELL